MKREMFKWDEMKGTFVNAAESAYSSVCKHADKAAVAVGAFVASAVAFATPVVDYSTAISTATAEITSSVASALPLFGTVMAIGIGIRIVHKFGRG